MMGKFSPKPKIPDMNDPKTTILVAAATTLIGLAGKAVEILMEKKAGEKASKR